MASPPSFGHSSIELQKQVVNVREVGVEKESAGAPLMVETSPPQSPGFGPTGQSIKDRSAFWGEWWWELVGWFLGSVALGAIFLLLIIYQDQAFDNWDGALQLSTVVAVLSQAAQSFLAISISSCIGQSKWFLLRERNRMIELETFDEASRGPEGSLKMIAILYNRMKPGGRKFGVLPASLALTGAFVTIMMLTFGFFTQESVTTGIRFVNSSTTAMGSISTARSYRFEDSFPPRPWSGTMAFSYIQGGGTEADSLLSRALISGAVANHSLSDIPAECPTSRCEWKSYTTLAICSSVEDISSELLGSSTPPPGENYLNLSLPVPELYSGRTDSAGRDHLWMGSVGNLYNRSDGTFSGPVNMVAEVYYVYFPPCAATHNTPGNLSMEAWKSSQAVKENWKAVKGTFNLCLQELNTTAINGSTTTTVVRREDRSPWQIDTSLRNVFYPVDNPQNLEGRLDYSMERSTMLALAENIKQTVNGSANLIAGGDNYWESALDLALGQDIFGPDPLYCTLNSNTDIGGLENRLRNISVSLTNTLRRNANGNLAISGSAFSAEQYYIVKLWWLSLPTLAWLITTALVLVTMWSTHANNLPGWKSSALPLLICTEPKNGMTHGEALRREAKSRDIQLKEDGAAWHLDRTL